MFFFKFFIVFSLSTTVLATEVDFNLYVNPQVTQYRQSGIFDLPKSIVKQPTYQSNQILEWQTDYAGFNLLGNWQYLVDTNETKTNKGSMLEAYYLTTLNKFDFSIGKKITSWGVGNAFRPTDIVLNENLLSTSNVSLEGTAQLGIEYFSDLGSITLIAAPNTYQDDLLALRYFESKDEGDYQVILAHSKNHNWQIGAAGVWIANDNLALHAEMLIQQDYSKLINSQVGANNLLNRAFLEQKYNNGLRFLIGSNYSWDNNNIIVEYWFDDLAYTKQQWQDLLSLSKNQKALLGGASDNAVYGNLAMNLSATNKAYLMQHNLFIRWSVENDDWNPSLSTLVAIEDKGLIITADTQRDYDWAKLNIGLRYFTGNKGSIYNQLLLRNQVYFSLNKFF